MHALRQTLTAAVTYLRAHPRLRFWCIVTAVAAPVVLLTALLARLAINVPFWDQWEMVPIFEHLHAGTLGFGELFAQHNEHRLLIPRLIWLGLATLTHWNTNAEVAISVLVAMIGFVFLWLLIRRTFTTRRLQYVATVVASIVFFSPLLQENWMWGWQIEWFISNTVLLFAVWALAVWRAAPVVRVSSAIVGVAIVTYSLGSGQFMWLILVPLFWLSKDLKKLLPAWIIAALVVVGSYYIGYTFGADRSTAFTFLHEPLAATIYFLVYIARPLVTDFLVSLPVAVLYVTSFALLLHYWWKKGKRYLGRELLPWLCIGGFVIIVGATTDIARLNLGIEQAYSSRYTTISMLLLIVAFILGLKFIEVFGAKMSRILQRTMWAVMAVAMLLVACNYSYGVKQMRQQHAHLLQVRQCAQTAHNESDNCLLLLYPNKKIVWPRLQYLRSIHWGGL